MTSHRVMACVAMLLAGSSLAYAADPAPAPATRPSTIVRADTPVKIDGVLDEACWQAAAPVLVNNLYGKVGAADASIPMTVKYAWDENYLYIGYEVFDKNITDVGTGQKQGPPNNQREGCEIARGNEKIDVVEFFVSFGDPHFMWEIHHNALNQFNDIWVTVPDPSWPISKSSICTFGIIFAPQEYLKDDGAFTVATAAKLKPKADGKDSTPNDPSDEDTGYTAEIRLPWRALATMTEWFKPADPKANRPAGWDMAGHNVSLLAVCQDGDREQRYHHSSLTFPGGWFHMGEQFWPVYQFASPATAQAEH